LRGAGRVWETGGARHRRAELFGGGSAGFWAGREMKGRLGSKYLMTLENLCDAGGWFGRRLLLHALAAGLGGTAAPLVFWGRRGGLRARGASRAARGRSFSAAGKVQVPHGLFARGPGPLRWPVCPRALPPAPNSPPPHLTHPLPKPRRRGGPLPAAVRHAGLLHGAVRAHRLPGARAQGGRVARRRLLGGCRRPRRRVIIKRGRDRLCGPRGRRRRRVYPGRHRPKRSTNRCARGTVALTRRSVKLARPDHVVRFLRCGFRIQTL
jgi:hypothetical protein